MSTTLAMKQSGGEGAKKRQRQRLDRFVNKFLTSATPVSIIGPLIDQNVIPTTRVMRKRTNRGSAPANDPKSATVSLDNYYILPYYRPEKRLHRPSSVGARKPSVKLIPSTPRKAKPSRRNKSVAPPPTEMGLFDYVQCDALPVGCTADAPFEERVALDLARIARRPTDIFRFARCQ